jgi:hypothetical protein
MGLKAVKMSVYAKLMKILRLQHADGGSFQPVSLNPEVAVVDDSSVLPVVAPANHPTAPTIAVTSTATVEAVTLSPEQQIAQAYRSARDQARQRLEDEIETAESKKRQRIGAINQTFYGGNCGGWSELHARVIRMGYEERISGAEGTCTRATEKAQQTFDDAVRRLGEASDTFEKGGEAALTEALQQMRSVLLTPKHYMFCDFDDFEDDYRHFPQRRTT